MADFTPTQGRYLAFIHAYSALHGCPPAESDMCMALRVSPPSVHNMVKMLEKKGLILRQPGQARSIQILVPEAEIPAWDVRKPAKSSAPSENRPSPVVAPPAKLYVFTDFLKGGPLSAKFSSRQISRVIEIRGDQTLEHLHQAIFKAYDRVEEHPYEFQFGKRPFDEKGPNFGIAAPSERKPGDGDARTTTLDALDLKPERVFGYWFDFGDNWYHQIQLERIEPAIPTVPYPRVIKRVGKSPPQHGDE